MAESSEQTKVEEQPSEDTKEKEPASEESTSPEESTVLKEQTPQQTEEPPPDAKAVDDGTPIVLVTGASGFVATHTIKNLLVEGRYRVRGTVRNSKNEAKVAPVHNLVPNAVRPLELVDADLTSEEAWKDAVRGCTYVLHLASPFPPPGKIKNIEAELTRPAIEGTLNVLKACAESGTVKRVVLVSSIAAVSSGLNGESGKVHTEDDWSKEEDCFPYELSKYKAERAAWDYIEKLEDSKKFEFVTICPSVVIGPALTVATTNNTSVSSCVTDLLANKLPGLPDVNFPLVDVRDVADAICSAMEKPDISNKRFIVANETLPIGQTAEIISAEFKPQGYKVPTKPMNKLLLWAVKKTATGKVIKAVEGKSMLYNIDRMKTELQITPRPIKSTILDTCYALIESGTVKKTKGYLGHPDSRPPTVPKTDETPKADEAPAEEPLQTEETAEAPPKETPVDEPVPKEEPPAEEPPKEEPPVEEPPAKEPPKEEPPAEEPPKVEPAKEPSKEEPPAEEPPKEEPPAEELPKEEPPAEEPPKEEPPAEEPPKEEPPAEVPPKEELPAEEPPKEEPPAEEQPKEESPAEEPPKEEPPAEEPPKEEAPAEEPPKEEPPAEEPPKEEPPAEEPPKEEAPAEEPPKEEPPAEEPPKEEAPAEEPPKEEPQTEEPPKEEPPAEEQPKEEPSAEEPPQEKSLAEEPLQEAEESPKEEPPTEDETLAATEEA